MLALYLGALVAAAGVFAVQLGLGHHDVGTADSAPDVTAHGAESNHDAGPYLAALASPRFWAFFLLAFGLVGTLITVFGFAGAPLTVVMALGSGLAAGAVAHVVVRRVLGIARSSHASLDGAVGRTGRVVVPPGDGFHGKVRIEMRGSFIDVLARSDEPLAVGNTVIVVAREGEVVVVTRAPAELGP